MTEDDVEELLEKAQDLQTELNDLHQQRVSKSDNADEKLVMFRKQVNLKFYFKFYFLFTFCLFSVLCLFFVEFIPHILG